MIVSLFSIFIVTFLFRRILSGKAFIYLVLISLLAFGQVAQKTIWAILIFFLVEQIVVWMSKRWHWKSSYIPLLFAATLITAHHASGDRITGVSYIVLAASLDLWARIQRPETLSWRQAFLNLILFPKIVVGPIVGFLGHRPKIRPDSEVARVGLFGIVKALLLTSLFRTYVPTPIWSELNSVTDYLWFGLWNYVHLYLEFSGACDLVTATFWSLGLDCPLNFSRPYLSVSITEFWKRWHMTLGAWIKNFVYIPLGGSRVPPWRIYVNLFAAMFISGAWHGLSPGFLGWGALQGVLLCLERALGFEQKLKNATILGRGIAWAVTQAFVICSWIIFFSPMRWP